MMISFTDICVNILGGFQFGVGVNFGILGLKERIEKIIFFLFLFDSVRVFILIGVGPCLIECV